MNVFLSKKHSQLLFGVFVALLFVVVPLFTANFLAMASSVSIQEGLSEVELEEGTVVSLDDTDTAKIVPTNQQNLLRSYGVVVGSDDRSTTEGADSVYTFNIAVSGDVYMRVSDESGIVRAGDLLTISSTPGVAMKAGPEDTFIVGRVLEGFDTNDGLSSDPVKKTLVQIAIGPTTHSGSEPDAQQSGWSFHEFLVSFSGRDVSTLKTYGSIGLLMATIVVSVFLVFSGARPHRHTKETKKKIVKPNKKQRIRLLISGIMIFIIMIFGVYLLIRI